jgi:formiminotetrahydrofolate cyclodeaminase
MRAHRHSAVGTFTADLAAGTPSPAGGSASALAGSIAAALIAMVCRVSLGKDDVTAGDEELREAVRQSDGLRSRLLDLVTEDALAFGPIVDAASMPEQTKGQRAVRGAALTRATRGATTPALETLAASREALELAAALAGRVNPEAASDLGVAVRLALAAAEGAALTADANLSALPPGDDTESSRHRIRVELEATRTLAAAASRAT